MISKGGFFPTFIMNIDRTKNLFQFILAFAGQADDYYHRRLRPIHLLKYAYLADLAFAKRNNGQTFTGITWKFHHFGPWSFEAYQQIDPAMGAIRAESRIIENLYDDKERIEWWWDGEDSEIDDLRRALPPAVVYSLQQHIKQFGGYATYDLLHYVYSTEPMLKAAPEDTLVFPAVTAPAPPQKIEPPSISAKQRKLRRARIAEAKTSLQEKLSRMIAKNSQSRKFTQPVYDEVFFQGMACIEAMATSDLPEGDYTLEIDPSIWKSGCRDNHDLP